MSPRKSSPSGDAKVLPSNDANTSSSQASQPKTLKCKSCRRAWEDAQKAERSNDTASAKIRLSWDQSLTCKDKIRPYLLTEERMAVFNVWNVPKGYTHFSLQYRDEQAKGRFHDAAGRVRAKPRQLTAINGIPRAHLTAPSYPGLFRFRITIWQDEKDAASVASSEKLSAEVMICVHQDPSRIAKQPHEVLHRNSTIFQLNDDGMSWGALMIINDSPGPESEEKDVRTAPRQPIRSSYGAELMDDGFLDDEFPG
ncbi:hypothetical protein Micbo1qcDRAFT_11336 [Microdochium bolleyi]|uniref:Uncharacterized protein n=1 Tax=Microdochium bolleyi TaxID=196109 RepID=A0A136IYQ9_9PEZI|nr:hypothetical protein Micbo1qcDRAFT_11336 [Microdochium bolleyi]